jgi:hypothetical protein
MKCKKLAPDACLFQTNTGYYLVAVDSRKSKTTEYYYPLVHIRKRFCGLIPYWLEAWNGEELQFIPKNDTELIDWFKQAVIKYEESLNQTWFEV